MYHSSFIKKFNSVYKHLSFIFLFILVTGFQNCYLDYSGESQASQSVDRDSISTISTEISGTGSSLSANRFSINTNLTLTIENIPSESSEVHWSVNRGFESVIDNAKTTGGESQHTFTQAGAHDISVIFYKNVQDFLTPIGSASKRVVIGDQCDATKILEIALTSGSLVAGQTATFGVRNENEFSDISWKTTLPSGTEVEAEGTSIQVSLSGESAGTLKLRLKDQNRVRVIV